MSTNSIQPLNSRERKYTQNLSLATKLTIITTEAIVAAIATAPYWSDIYNGTWNKVDIKSIALGFIAISVLNIIFAWWPNRHFSKELKNNEKVVEKTTISRLQKLGFFDSDNAIGPAQLLSSVYYVWIPDESRDPPERRFKINLDTYKQLLRYKKQSSDQLMEISYLPKSKKVLSITAGEFHYSVTDTMRNR